MQKDITNHHYHLQYLLAYRKPLPLTTVELQKSATRFLNMSSDQAMAVSTLAITDYFY